MLADLAEVGASYIPGHGHADCLSYELSIDKFRVFVNGGTSLYEEGDIRMQERGTASHNTVIVDGKNSSQIWSSFRIAKRASPQHIRIENDKSKIVLSASHNGYAYLKNRPTHKRKWTCTEDYLIIEDFVTPPYPNTFARFILHPQIDLLWVKEGEFELKLPNGSLYSFQSSAGKIEDTFFSQEFGMRNPTKAISIPIFSGYCHVSIHHKT